jgi:hypothetical protein
VIKAQSGIRKSGILSPWRNPLDPGDRFYRRVSAITRAIMNLNATQHVSLDSTITVAGDCEIEFYAKWPGASGGWFFADTTNDNENESRFLTNGTGISGYGFPSNTVLSEVPATGVIHKFEYIKSGSTVSFYANGTLLATASYSGPIVLDSFFTKWSSNTGIPNYSGNVFSIEIKQSGVTTNYWPFDDNGGVLRDTVGGNNGTIINYVPGDWETVTKKPSDDFWVGDGDRVIEYAEGAL